MVRISTQRSVPIASFFFSYPTSANFSFFPMNVLYASAFGPAPYPARTTCVVQALPDPKMLIEIEGVASLERR